MLWPLKSWLTCYKSFTAVFRDVLDCTYSVRGVDAAAAGDARLCG